MKPDDIEVPEDAYEFVKEIADRLLSSGERELENTAAALSGRYVEPGPSGNPTRGDVDVLPTGKNFYSVDPRKVPTERAFEVGRKMADKTVERYLEKHGEYPRSVGVVLWASDVMRTGGEVLGKVMWLLGVRPVRDDAGNVIDVEPVPVEELGRPRVDVVVRISGMFRDAFPNLVELVERAFRKVENLDEPADVNPVSEGPRHRVFGDPPGAYGAGVNYAVHSSAWEDRSDLAEVYVKWGGYAYGRDVYGEPAFEEFEEALSRVRVVSLSQSSHEWDVLSCCCHFAFHGGMVAAAEELSGRRVECFHHDTTDPHRVVTRDIEKEIERLVDQKLANDEWIEAMLKHGAKGAGDWLKRVSNMLGWAATTRRVPEECWEKVEDTLRRFEPEFEDANPYVVKHARKVLEEARRRGFF